MVIRVGRLVYLGIVWTRNIW